MVVASCRRSAAIPTSSFAVVRLAMKQERTPVRHTVMFMVAVRVTPPTSGQVSSRVIPTSLSRTLLLTRTIIPHILKLLSALYCLHLLSTIIYMVAVPTVRWVPIAMPARLMVQPSMVTPLVVRQPSLSQEVPLA